jgi:hypothetical protein
MNFSSLASGQVTEVVAANQTENGIGCSAFRLAGIDSIKRMHHIESIDNFPSQLGCKQKYAHNLQR